MSNPWGIKLKKTGLIEERLNKEQSALSGLESRQIEMMRNLETDKERKNVYDDRQSSLAADAMKGQQERLGGRRTKRRNKGHKKTRKNRKSRSRRYRK